MDIRCSFCNRPYVEGELKVIQSATEPDKAICFDCVTWLKSLVDADACKEHDKDCRPDETQRGD